MSEQAKNQIADRIRRMAEERHVVYVRTPLDSFAHHVTRLAGDDVHFDEIEQLLIALQRGGHLSRAAMIQLQAAYLREARP